MAFDPDFEDDDDYGDDDPFAGMQHQPPHGLGSGRDTSGGFPLAINPDPPWKMWGGAQVASITSTGGAGNAVVESHQLARVNYKRPEAWHFLFSGRLIQAPDTGALESVTVTLIFDLIVGIGRTIIQLPQFERLQWAWSNGEAAPKTVVLTSDAGLGTRLRASGGALTTHDIDQIVAQDIQCNCRVAVLSTGFNATCDIEFGAMFAPKVHVRPDWFLKAAAVQKFRGDELGGT